MKRRDARETAFTLIFERSFREESLDNIIRSAVIGRGIEVDEYAYKLADLTFENLSVIDQKIEAHLTGWKISRISRVTLALLRLAICEIDHFADIPVSVTINEAVELTKKYAGEEDASYLNGVLGGYVKSANPTKA